MTTANPTATKGLGPRGKEHRIPPPVRFVVLAAVLATFGLICYSIGSHRGAGRHVLTGRAFVSPYQGEVTVNGWAYGFDISQNGMHWYDARGRSHEGGIPPCMQHGSTYTWIRFGWSPARGQHESWRVVTWVQCIRRP
jgi:hypothetical protein